MPAIKGESRLAIKRMGSGIDNCQVTQCQSAIHGLRKSEGQWFEGAGTRHPQGPLGGVRGLSVRRADAERFDSRRLHRTSQGIRPGGVDHQSKALSSLQGRADVFKGLDFAFDAAGIDEKRKPGHTAVPQLFINLEKGKFDVVTSFVFEMNVLIDLSSTHGGTEVKVKFQQIFWNDINRWIDLAHYRGGGGVWHGHRKISCYRRQISHEFQREPPWLKACMIGLPALPGKAGCKHEGFSLHSITTQHGGHAALRFGKGDNPDG